MGVTTEWSPMFVTVIHHIHDPEGFQAAEAKALEAGLPSHVALPIHAAIKDHKPGMCIWEGESVEAVREVVEGAVGPWARGRPSSLPSLFVSMVESAGAHSRIDHGQSCSN
jgi:hypothetical protein